METNNILSLDKITRVKSRICIEFEIEIMNNNTNNYFIITIIIIYLDIFCHKTEK